MADQSSSNIGPWIVSLLALIQVWIIELWRKYRHGIIQIYESGTIEIGYGQLGPSIGLTGALRCVHKDVFVKRMFIELTRQRDRAQHVFNWRAFRSSTISLGPNANQQLELVGSFLVTSALPYKYNVFFVDDRFVREHRGRVEPIAQRWHEFVRAKLAALTKGTPTSLETLTTEAKLAVANALFGEFLKEKDVLEAYSALDRGIYWEEGEYELILGVECAEPERTFRKRWTFRLEKGDADRLRLNTVAILQAVCGLTVNYNFAYPEYTNPRAG